MQETVIEIDCDGCGDEIQIQVAENQDEEAIEEKLTANGWSVQGDEIYCSVCR